MKGQHRIWAVFVLSLILSACGGGDPDKATAIHPAPMIYGNMVDNSVSHPHTFGFSASNTRAPASGQLRKFGHLMSQTWVMDGLSAGTSTIFDSITLAPLVVGDAVRAGMTVRNAAGTDTSQIRVAITFYDDAGSYKGSASSGLKTPTTAGETIAVTTVVPVGATKAKIGVAYSTINSLTIEHAGLFIVDESLPVGVYYNETDNYIINSHWIGKRLAVLGDSITYPADAWHRTAAIQLGFTQDIVNLSESGHTLSSAGSVGTVCDQADALVDGYAADEIDLIVVQGGTNDYTAQFDLGDVEAEATAVIGNVDKKTISGAVRYISERLRAHFPSAKIVFGLPIQRAVLSDWLHPTHLKSYADAIESMALRCACPSFDAYSESGIDSFFEVDGGVGRYLRDGLHPNADGKLKMGDYYTEQISKILP